MIGASQPPLIHLAGNQAVLKVIAAMESGGSWTTRFSSADLNRLQGLAADGVWVLVGIVHIWA